MHEGKLFVAIINVIHHFLLSVHSLCCHYFITSIIVVVVVVVD